MNSLNENDSTGTHFDYLVYPNPFVYDFKIRYTNTNGEKTAYVRVLDAGGKVVYEGSQDLFDGVNELNIDGSALASGIYFVSLRVGQETATKSILK